MVAHRIKRVPVVGGIGIVSRSDICPHDLACTCDLIGSGLPGGLLPG
jgi:hypothetical protein